MSRSAKKCLDMLSLSSRHPLITIVGATGTGKSQLAVSLAVRFNGEIINGDALQMYEGLPITTNKIPVEERKGIPHHLLGCIKLQEEPWTIKEFLSQATTVISEIRSRGRLPILVGGTHYYTHSLLFEGFVVAEESEGSTPHEEQVQDWPILDASTEVILQELRKVDPVMAMRWHPNDRRKLRRSLELYLKTGKKASEIYDRQQKVRADHCKLTTKDSSSDTEAKSLLGLQAPLHYDNLVFWLHASSDVLLERLEKRVDSMIIQGLLEEATSMFAFLQHQQRQGTAVDQSRGKWIAIGFKELLPYIMDESKPASLRQEGIERMKIATRQYAKRQTRWIKLKLQRALDAAGARGNMFMLDGTDLSQWSLEVEGKASTIVTDFLLNRTLPQPESLSCAAKENLLLTEENARSARFCETCDKTLMSEQEWAKHLKSKRAQKRHKTKSRLGCFISKSVMYCSLEPRQRPHGQPSPEQKPTLVYCGSCSGDPHQGIDRAFLLGIENHVVWLSFRVTPI